MHFFRKTTATMIELKQNNRYIQDDFILQMDASKESQRLALFSTVWTVETRRRHYLYLSSTWIATQGGAVSQFFCLFSLLLVDDKKRTYFFRFSFFRHFSKLLFKTCQ